MYKYFSMEDRILIFTLFGGILGALLPFIAGRFGKLIPADPGEILLRLFHKPRIPSNKSSYRYSLWLKKKHLLSLWSVFWAMMTASLFVLCSLILPEEIQVISCVFVWIVSACIIVDADYWLLPDFFTLPLLILGFLFVQISPNYSLETALVGAIGGYIVSILSVLCLAFSPKKQLGCGDVKMIAALGAWLGISGLSTTLVISFVLFVLFDLLHLHKKGAYGPALGTAALFTFFLIHMK